MLDERPGVCREVFRQKGDVIEAGDVDDERVVGGPVLGREDMRDGVGVEGVGAEAVDGLGGEGHEVACPEVGGGFLRRGGQEGAHSFSTA